MICIRKAVSIVVGLMAFFAAWSQALGVITVPGITTCLAQNLSSDEFSIAYPVNGPYAIDASNSLLFEYYDNTHTVFFFTNSTVRIEGVLVLAGGETVVWDIPASTGWPSLHGVIDPATGQPYPPDEVTFCFDDPPTPTYACTGFETPFDQTINLKKSNRAIPLKAILQEQAGALVTPTTLDGSAGPVVQVSFESGIGGGVDVTSELMPVGQSSDGNQFNFDPTTSTWWLNLGTSPYTAKGTYVISLLSGDATKYRISPECTGSFSRE